MPPITTAYQRFPNTRTPDGNAYAVTSPTVSVKNKDDLNAVQSRIETLCLSAAALALGFSVAVGLFFGIYPAQRAARLNPLDTLQYE